MSYTNNIQILVADNDEQGRQLIADLLSNRGYQVTQALDGGSAIKVVEEKQIDIAIIGHHMYPKSGFDFARHVLVKGYNLGIVMVTDDNSTDLLIEAGKHEIKKIMRKPLDPDKLIETVRRVLRSQGKNPDALGSAAEISYGPEELMKRTLVLAQQNSDSGMGGPFGALIIDEQGRIIGEGVHGVHTRCDPTAHAEVMAIRRATDRMNRTDLSGCTIYCSSEPTMLGQALIIGTGIEKVFYALTYDDVGGAPKNEKGIIGEMNKPRESRNVPYEQIYQKEARTMLSSLKKK